jgi:Sec-independent protein translocase protein TatA
MRLGLSEILLIIAIFSVVLGPAVYGWVGRWMRRAQRSSAAAARRRAARDAQRRAEMDATLRRFQRAGSVFLAVLAVLLLYALFLRPIANTPQAYTAPAAPTEQTVATSPAAPQSVGQTGKVTCARVRGDWLYLAYADEDTSWIERSPMGTENATAAERNTLVQVPGCEITAFDFDAEGQIWFTTFNDCSGQLFLASYDEWGSSAAACVTTIDGAYLNCLTAVVCAPDGKVYFADAAAVTGETASEDALNTILLTHTTTGTVYVYDPAARTVETVLGGLAGATGLALSPDGQTLYVAECAERRVWQMDAAARNRTAGSRECTIFAEDLAWYPSALACGQDGTVYVAGLLPYSSRLEGTAQKPFWRGVALRLTANVRAKLLGANSNTGAIAYTASGEADLLYASAAGGVRAVCPTGDGVCIGTSAGAYYVRD